MIVGDKIATANRTCDNVPAVVEVIAIEKGEIRWTHTWTSDEREHWHIEYAHVDAWADTSSSRVAYHAIGRVRKRDRGLTWAPAWIETEVALLTVAAALRITP